MEDNSIATEATEQPVLEDKYGRPTDDDGNLKLPVAELLASLQDVAKERSRWLVAGATETEEQFVQRVGNAARSAFSALELDTRPEREFTVYYRIVFSGQVEIEAKSDADASEKFEDDPSRYIDAYDLTPGYEDEVEVTEVYDHE